MSTEITTKLPEKVQQRLTFLRSRYIWNANYGDGDNMSLLACDADMYLRALHDVDLITPEEFDQIYDDIIEEGNKIWKEKHA